LDLPTLEKFIMASNLFFYDPYQTSALLEGVIPANQIVRPNFLQEWFPNGGTRETPTVNFDKEFMTRRTSAMYVAPRADAPLVQLQGFGSQEMRFAYVKEGIAAPDWEQLQGRMIGEQFNSTSPDYWARYNAHLAAQMAVSEGNIETLFEINAANLIFTGKHTAKSDLHPTVVYDFNRTKVTTDAEFQTGYVPEVDLSTLVSNGGAGKRAWNATGGTKAPTPYKDVCTAVRTVRRRGGVECVIMSADVYPYLEADINTNYKDAANLTLAVQERIDLKILPQVDKYLDLTYQRMLPIMSSSGGGEATTTFVPVFTYEAIYHDRLVGDELSAQKTFVPNGYMAVLPTKDKGVKLYGRILHSKAQFRAMPRFINAWMDEKNGDWSSEIQLNYLMGFRDVDSFVSWRVLA